MANGPSTAEIKNHVSNQQIFSGRALWMLVVWIFMLKLFTISVVVTAFLLDSIQLRSPCVRCHVHQALLIHALRHVWLYILTEHAVSILDGSCWIVLQRCPSAKLTRLWATNVLKMAIAMDIQWIASTNWESVRPFCKTNMFKAFFIGIPVSLACCSLMVWLPSPVTMLHFMTTCLRGWHLTPFRQKVRPNSDFETPIRTCFKIQMKLWPSSGFMSTPSSKHGEVQSCETKARYAPVADKAPEVAQAVEPVCWEKTWQRKLQNCDGWSLRPKAMCIFYSNHFFSKSEDCSTTQVGGQGRSGASAMCHGQDLSGRGGWLDFVQIFFFFFFF